MDRRRASCNGDEEPSVMLRGLSKRLIVLVLASTAPAGAVASAELVQDQTYTYGRFEARLRFAAGDGVVSSFFLWKPGSEMPGTFWNELDFEKLGADCHLQTNPLYGAPVVDHGQVATLTADLCNEKHTYTFEWTPTYIAYLVDGVEIRRDVGEAPAAFLANAASGMQIHFNVWPGDATFGGNFSPAILPVQQFIAWVQYSSFADEGFNLEWREDFASGVLPSGWSLGTWPSPKELSTHQPANVGFVDGFSVLSLTADDATGFSGAPPADQESSVPAPGDSGAGGSGSEPTGPATGGASTNGGAAGAAGNGSDTGGEASSGAAGAASGTAPGNPMGGSSGQALPPTASPAKSDSGCSQAGSSPSSGIASVLAVGLGILARRRRRANTRS
jgi:endo-1,3-1,4-beta-glycanase ExoK